VKQGKGAGARPVEEHIDSGVPDKRLMMIEPDFLGHSTQLF
jgi:hypothetical protein